MVSAAAGAATFEATGIGAAVGATVATNALNCEPLTNDIGWAITVGALAPLASGETAVVAAGEGAVGRTAANIFSGATGAAGIVGAVIDPNSTHRIEDNGCACLK